jgi:hypothetical protein
MSAAWLLLLVPLWLCASCRESAFRKELKFTAAQLQEKVEKHFPLEQKNALVRVEFSDPLVILKKGDERLGLRAGVEVVPIVGRAYRGVLEADARVEYRPHKGEFYLVDTRLRELEIEEVPEKYRQVAQEMANQLLKKHLAELFVYRLHPGDFKKSLARLVLRSVRVEEGELVLEIGLL